MRATVLLIALLALLLTSSKEQGLARDLDQWLTTVYPPGEPGASVLVRQGQDVVLRKGYGLANVEWGVSVSPRTVFRLASITKQFTAIAVLMLVQEGRLALDAPIVKYLPDIHERATVEQLLTHTSGLRTLAYAPGFPIWSKVELTPREVVGLFQDQPRAFPPGEGWEYSDAGYILLGLLIEQVSGMSYEQFVRERIFVPLGMTDSYYDNGTDIVRRRAAGYSKATGGFENAPARSMSVPFSSGALASTIDDLARWDEALSEDRLVEHSLIARALTAHVLPNGQSTSYGFGWLANDIDGEHVVQHGGRISGFEAHILRVPARRILIVVLSNTVGRDPAPDFVAMRMLRTLRGPAPEKSVALAPAAMRAYVGRYRFSEGAEYEVGLDRDGLFTRNESGEVRELICVGKDRFHFATSYTQVRFVRDTGGVVSGMGVQTAYESEYEARKVDIR